MEILKVGNVVYDPRVTVIWEMIEKYAREENFPIENVYFKDYTSQVAALIKGEIDVAWNSPIGWVEAEIKSGGRCPHGVMRDTDQDRKTYIITRKDGSVQKIGDLKNKKIGFGAKSSPEARLIPINYLHKEGLKTEDYEEVNFDVLSELLSGFSKGSPQMVQALENGQIDAFVFMDAYWNKVINLGIVDQARYTIIAETPLYDHCIFSARPDIPLETLEKWNELLLKMDYNKEQHKKMMDMEGLKKWVPGRTEKFTQLEEAARMMKVF